MRKEPRLSVPNPLDRLIDTLAALTVPERHEPRWVCRRLYSGWLNFPDVSAVRDHAVEDSERFPGRRSHGGFHRFSRLLLLLLEGLERRRVARRISCGEIRSRPDGGASPVSVWSDRFPFERQGSSSSTLVIL